MDETKTQRGNPTERDLEQLLERLTKPTFVWRMARAMLTAHHTPHVRSARTRRQNALREVREVLELLGWRYEGADHERTAEELLR